MKNIYNKGKYNVEYGKIPQWFRKLGNKRWRKDENKVINEILQLENTNYAAYINRRIKLRKKHLRKNRIKAKVTYKGYNDILHSYQMTFNSEKSFRDSIKRKSVIRVYINSKKIK